MKEEFLTVREATELLKVNPMTIYRYIKAGKLPAYKIGKDYRIKKEDFEKFLEQRKTVRKR